MCGICGAVAFDSALELPSGAPERMIGVMRHRGPDEYGAWRDAHAFLGHARLSIIDLDTGQQPLGDAAGRAWLVFNGEIFNYVELREELRALGHTFRTSSDTEVVVEAYRRWGDDCVERFNGQFAFALWDTGRRRLLLARDRFGIRPLFWTVHEGMLLFASEVKALGGWPGLRLELDPGAVAEIFTYWVNVPPLSPFRNVRQLPAGCTAVLDLGREGNVRPELNVRRYWHPTFLPAAEDRRFVDRAERADMARRVRDLLTDAAVIRLRADVPVGAYLSGGLDSSATAALIKDATARRMKTFSVGFKDVAYDESRWQRAMVSHLGTDHESIDVGDAEIAGAFDRVVWHAETPILRTAPSPLYALSGLVHRQDYKVVLTGEGADEVFCGYNILREAKVRAFWARDPRSVRRPLLLSRLYPYLQQSPAGFAAQFYGAGLEAVDDDPFFSHRPRWRNTAATAGFLSAGVVEAASARDPETRLREQLPPAFADWGPVARAQYLEMTLFMAGYLLSSQGDRMLMGHTVEGRFPFLDHRVAELAGTLPADAKLAGLDEKSLLKQAVADLLPEEIVRRPKQPYRAPDSASFFVGPGAELARGALDVEAMRETGLVDAGRVSALVRKWQAGKLTGTRDNMAFVGVLSLQLLARQFGNEFADRVAAAALRPDEIAWRGGTAPGATH